VVLFVLYGGWTNEIAGEVDRANFLITGEGHESKWLLLLTQPAIFTACEHHVLLRKFCSTWSCSVRYCYKFKLTLTIPCTPTFTSGTVGKFQACI